jgi:membrane protein implicated in regulation of membrane protease activity
VSAYVIWVLLGLALLVIEVMSGSLYLLMFGLGALAAALAAWLRFEFVVQALLAGVVALIGSVLVHRWHRSRPHNPNASNALDQGQLVQFERWLDQAQGLMRVNYRGTQWDARAAKGLAETSVLYITGQDGQTLLVGSKPGA